MGLLKDVYEIIVSEPDARKDVSKAILDFLKGGGWFSWFRASPSVQERKDNLKPLIAQLTKGDFASKFADTHAFFAALLGITVEAVRTAGRGCLVEKLFLPEYCFYFPPTAQEPSLARIENRFSKEVLRGLVYKNKTPYIFYAVRKVDKSPTDIAQLRKKLKDIALANPVDGESKEFTNWLTKGGYGPIALTGISQNPTTLSLHYQPKLASALDEPLQLNYVDSTATKSSLARELNDLLDSTLV